MQGEWFYRSAGDSFEHGPFEFARLRRLAQKGLLGEGTEIREGEFGPWIASSDVSGLYPEPLADYSAPTPIDVPFLTESVAVPTSTPEASSQSPPANLVVSFPANWLKFVEERVAALETENRRWKWAALLFAALAIAGWARSLPG